MTVTKTGDPLRRKSTRYVGVRRPSPLTPLVALLATIAASTLAGGCQIVGGYESFHRGDGAAPHPCDVLPSSKVDDKGLVTLVLSKQPDGSCYWIDKTEVTVQEYSRFLAEHDDPVSWDSDLCGWKTKPSDPVNAQTECSMATDTESDPFAATKPIRCVDWCDAKAFCNWAGKELCYGTSNGSFVRPLDVPDRWGNACSADGLPYVYGPKPLARACNIGLNDLSGACYSLLGQYRCAPTDVDNNKFAKCTSPSGAVDMIGNVAEWVYSCGVADGGPSTLCQYRGGSFADSVDHETCYTVDVARSETQDPGLGLRCCADLTVPEKHLVK